MFSNLTNLLFSATALLLFVKVVYSSNKYCELESCSNPKRHVLCLFPNVTVDPRCKPHIRSGLTEREKQRLLKLHVQIRNDYAVRARTRRLKIVYPELLWDDNLAMMAQRWADQCPLTQDECRSVDEYSYIAKQNVGHFVLTYEPTFKLVKDWALKPLNPANPAVRKFRDIDRIGCGLTVKSRCDYTRQRAWLVDFGCRDVDIAYVVCNYSIFKIRLRVRDHYQALLIQ